MRISFLSFLVGCILIGVAVIGGGFEVKEIKMPRVGILVRLLSAGVGLAFIFLGIGLEFPDPNGSSPATAALAAGALTDTAGPPSPGAGVVTQADASVAYTDSAPASAPAPASYADEFSGFSGSSTLTWSVQGVPVSGTTYMNGATGMIRITYVDAEGQQVLVDEDLQLQQGEGKFWYAGSNPRYAGTETAVPEYRLDSFTVVQADGGWTFGEACDAGGCNPVTVQ
jgi:hypothetical protein